MAIPVNCDYYDKMTTLHGYEIKEGDIVYDSEDNPIKVTRANSSCNYPILAECKTYAEDGKWSIVDKYPSIFWPPPNIKEALELAKIKPKQKVTKYKVVYKNQFNGLSESISTEYYRDADEFTNYSSQLKFICLVKELSKEFEE